MTINVGNPRRFEILMPGDTIYLGGSQGVRPVTLEVNSETDVSWKVIYEEGDVRFLATTKGRDKLRFVAEGRCHVEATSEGEVYYDTDDGRIVAYVNDDAEVFAQPHRPRTGDERVIYMQRLQILNMERNEAKMLAIVERAEARAKEAQIAAAKSAPEKEVDGDDGKGGVVERPEEPEIKPAPDAKAT